MRQLLILALALAVAAGRISVSQAQVALPAQVDFADFFRLVAGDQYAYDDNLFRLPAGYSVSALGPNPARQDHINSLIAGFDGQWSFLQQDIRMSARVNNNRFAQNTLLNNTSGTATVNLDWLLNSRLSGTAGMDFTRAQASFADTFFFAKDLVDTTEYFATAQLRLAQHWNLTGGITESDTTHSASQRAADEIRGKYSNLGIQYVTSDNNSFGFEYHYTDADHPFLSFFNGEQFNSTYIDEVEQFTVKYLFSQATQLRANAGYIKRRYPYADFGSFSGGTWRATLTSQITGKTQLSAAAWRELTAYLDASTDYFVARGESLSAIWAATAKVGVSLTGTYTGQDYIDSSASALLFDHRHDIVKAAQASLDYLPLDSLHLTLSYRLEKRDSTIAQFGYITRIASAQLTYQFL